MKLLNLSNRYYFVGLFIISLIAGISSYFIIKNIINSEFNDKLFAEKEELIEELHQHDDILSSYNLNIGDNISIQKVNANPQIEPFIKDTVLYNKYEKKELNYRQIIFSDRVKDDFYILTISKSLLSTEDLIKGVTEIIAIITILFFSTILVLNNIISKKIWKPFYNTLELIKKFNIQKPNPLSFNTTKIVEFRELNSALDLMTNQVIKDYKNLKEYTENTSHEIQTPLAIIKNKIELLIQDPNVSEKQFVILNQIYEATSRLSRLKDNLSLLSKIDNNHFIETTELRLANYLKERIENVTELIELKKIEVTLNFEKNPIISINETMAYVLFNNLIINAIRHNEDYGKLELTLTNEYFRIKNTGKPLKIDEKELFKRFKKSGKHSESNGLGLSLVHRIVQYYNFSIQYKNVDIWHIITITF